MSLPLQLRRASPLAKLRNLVAARESRPPPPRPGDVAARREYATRIRSANRPSVLLRRRIPAPARPVQRRSPQQPFLVRRQLRRHIPQLSFSEFKPHLHFKTLANAVSLPALRHILGYGLDSVDAVPAGHPLSPTGIVEPPGSSMMDVLFVCIDVDGDKTLSAKGETIHERLERGSTIEVGISTLDTRALRGMIDNASRPAPNAIGSVHFTVGSAVDSGTQAQAPLPFGNRERVTWSELKSYWEGLTAGREVVIVSHTHIRERLFLKSFDPGLRPLFIFDVSKIPDLVDGPAQKTKPNLSPAPSKGLKALLTEYGIEHPYLHTAGYDARFTLQLLLMMAAKDAERLAAAASRSSVRSASDEALLTILRSLGQCEPLMSDPAGGSEAESTMPTALMHLTSGRQNDLVTFRYLMRRELFLALRERKLSLKQPRLEASSVKLQAKSKELQVRMANVAKVEAAMKAAEVDLQSRMANVAKTEASVKAAEADLATRSATFVAKASEITTVGKAIAEDSAKLDAREADLREMEKKLTLATKGAEEETAQMKAREKTVKAREFRLALREEMLEAREDRLVAREGRLVAREGRVEVTEARQASREAGLDARKARLDEKATKVNGMLNRMLYGPPRTNLEAARGDKPEAREVGPNYENNKPDDREARRSSALGRARARRKALEQRWDLLHPRRHPASRDTGDDKASHEADVFRAFNTSPGPGAREPEIEEMARKELRSAW